MRALIATLLLLAAPLANAQEPKAPEKTRIAGEKELVDDDGYVLRLSLPTVADVSAWDEPGLRIGLAYGYGRQWGSGPAIDLGLHAFTIRVLSRIDRLWSVGLDFQYAFASGTLGGLRYASTVQAMLHPWRSLAFTVGVGIGGFMLTPPGAVTTRPGNGGEVASVTYGPNETLGSCSGSAWIGLARAEYLFVAGPMFSSGPYLETGTQYTRCGQTLGRTDRETGNPIYGRQWWLHGGATAGWWFTWR